MDINFRAGKPAHSFCLKINAKMSLMKHITNSKFQTQKLAKNLAKQLVKHQMPNKKHALVVGLSGELGSGKTTFVQGFAKALGIKERIISPTFVILKKFKIKDLKFLTHIDAYRIKNSKEILDLGWKNMLVSPENIILVEWPEKIKKIFPKQYFWLNFSHKGKSKRSIDIHFVK